MVPHKIKENLGVTASVAADIKKRMDAEDVVVTFNKKLYAADFDSMIAKIRETLYISDHKDKITVICKAYTMLRNDDETSRVEVKELAEKFIYGEIKHYDEIIKKYKVVFQHKYRAYEKLFTDILTDITNLPEWAEISDEQKLEVKKLIKFTKLDHLGFDELKVNGLGTLDDFRRILAELSAAKTKAVEKVHVFNDYNEMIKKQASTSGSSDAQNPPMTQTASINNRVSKKLRAYSNGKIINIDSLEKLSELDDAFNEIKEKIKRDIESGKKITLEL